MGCTELPELFLISEVGLSITFDHGKKFQVIGVYDV